MAAGTMVFNGTQSLSERMVSDPWCLQPKGKTYPFPATAGLAESRTSA